MGNHTELMCLISDAIAANTRHGAIDSGKIADAVLAWLAEPAQIERMAAAAHDNASKAVGGLLDPWDAMMAGPREAERDDIRAAVAALREPRA